MIGTQSSGNDLQRTKAKVLNLGARSYIAIMSVAGAVIMLMEFSQWRWHSVERHLWYLLFAALLSKFKVKLPGVNGTMSVNFVIILLGVIDLDLPQTLTIAWAGCLTQCLWHAEKRPTPIQLLFNVSSITTTCAACYLVSHAAIVRASDNSFITLLVLASLTYFLANTISVSIIVALTERKSLWNVWYGSFFWTVAQYLIGAALAGIVHVCTRYLGWQVSVLVAPCIYLVYRSYRIYLSRLEDEKRQLEIEIAGHKRTQKELLIAQSAAEESNRAKSAFLANMSHELRTPLNAIIGYSEILIEDAEDADQTAPVPDLKKIQSAGKNLLALVNDILDLSKVESGKMELHVETFELSDVLREVVSTIDPLVEKNRNLLLVRCADDTTSVHADMTKFRQILLNLLSNACKFTQNGSISLDIETEMLENQSWVTCRVSDTGIGMAPEEMGKLFVSVYQPERPLKSAC